MKSELRGFGAGLRAPHYSDILADDAGRLDWFEAITENYLEPGGQPRAMLRRIRERAPVTLHGVSLSLGSTDPIDRRYLRAVRDLAREIEPALVSDHLCFSSLAGQHVHDLWPLPRTEESLAHLVPRILEVQDALGRPLVVENISAYIAFGSSTIAESEFLAELCRRTDCRLLVDLNNLYVCERNLGVDPFAWLAAIPAHAVAQLHLAGHSDEGTQLLDTHDAPVCAEVWSLYRVALARFGAVPTMVEWDEQIPAYGILCDEVDKARRIAAEVES
jgi:uncharacterized protein (UPF0276 family)